MFRVNNKDARTTPMVDAALVSLLLTLLTIVNFSLLLTFFTPCVGVSIVNFEHVISGWARWTTCKTRNMCS